MAFGKIAAAVVRPGKTVELVLNMLPGSPVIRVEHLGEENAGYLNDQIARANTKVTLAPGKFSKAALAEAQKRWRETLAKHAVRGLEAKHDDGRDATAADIPEFMQSIPGDVVDMIRDFALNAENFRERPIEGDPSELAEKS